MGGLKKIVTGSFWSLIFSASGNPDDLFRIVLERAGLTREDLGKMCQSGFQHTGDRQHIKTLPGLC